jgi:hypothetical protein
LLDAPDETDTYLAAQLIKTKLHTSSGKLDFQSVFKRVQQKQMFLRMLFVPRNNKYAFQLKEGFGKPMLDQAFADLQRAVREGDKENTTLFLVNISLIVSGCSRTKQLMDSKLSSAISMAAEMSL